MRFRLDGRGEDITITFELPPPEGECTLALDRDSAHDLAVRILIWLAPPPGEGNVADEGGPVH